MELAEALRHYERIQKELLRAQTLMRYMYVLHRFVAWCEQSGVRDTDALTTSTLREWLTHVRERPLQIATRQARLDAATVHHHAVITKIFIRWLEREEIITVPISVRFSLPRNPEKHPAVLSSADVQQLLSSGGEQHKARPWATEALTARNFAIVVVFVDTGLRRAELAKLRLCDIDYELLLLYVERKGGKRQAVPISSEAMDALDDYLTQHRPTLARGARARREDLVFLNGKGTPLGADGISSLFRRLQQKVAIDDKQVSPHALRRYMATTQLALGRDSLHVQRQMGHRSLSTTNRYVALSTEQLRASHEQYSPLRAALSAAPARPHKHYYQEE